MRSRARRKRASRLARWISALFVVGSTCFMVAPLQAFLDLFGATTDGIVFFVGSVFFTSAATLQWLETVNAERGATAPAGIRTRVFSWEPRRIEWWSSGVQLLGTLFFNISTLRALSTAVNQSSYDQVVWRPDAFGSVCFLVSGYLAYVEVAGGLLARPGATLEGTIVSVNLFGCLAFGVSAVGAYVLPATGEVVNVTAANATTSIGALAFLVGAVLLLPEARRAAV